MADNVQTQDVSGATAQPPTLEEQLATLQAAVDSIVVPTAIGEITKEEGVARDSLPTRPVIGQYTEEDAPLPDMVGEDIVAGYWQIGYHAVEMFSDTTDEEGVVTTKAEHEAAYQARLDADAAKATRKERDSKLAETDWRFRSDLVASQAWIDYCQALRDVPSQEGFPHAVEWPVEPVE